MSAPRKLIVIMEHGKVIGTQLAVDKPHGATANAPVVTAMLTAGPGQSRHEVMTPVPDSFESERDIARFHESLIPLVNKTK